jgi:hypothetical protein
VKYLTREELQLEVARLRLALENAGVEPQEVGTDRDWRAVQHRPERAQDDPFIEEACLSSAIATRPTRAGVEFVQSHGGAAGS